MKIVLDPHEEKMLFIYENRINIYERGKTIDVIRACGCKTTHTTTPKGCAKGMRGGTWSKTPSLRKFSAKLATSVCFNCREKLEWVKLFPKNK